MKRIVIMAVVILIANLLEAQTTSKIKLGQYKFTASVTMKRAIISGKTDFTTADTLITSLPNQKFKIIRILDKDTVLIQILNYNLDKDGNPTEAFYIYNFRQFDKDGKKIDAKKSVANVGANQYYFKISKDDLESYAVEDERIAWALSTGVISFPFKYRPQKGIADFTGAFNFGAAIGVKFPRPTSQKFSYSILLGYSLSNIVLDSASINNQSNLSKLQSANNFTALSFSTGFMVEYEKVQAGIFLGWDRLSRITNSTFDWKYQGKPWISIGFGYSIFSNEKATTSNSTTNKQP